MKTVSRALFDRNVLVQNDLWIVASRYQKMRDARWMFAFAHFRITQQINDGIRSRGFRDPDRVANRCRVDVLETTLVDDRATALFRVVHVIPQEGVMRDQPMRTDPPEVESDVRPDAMPLRHHTHRGSIRSLDP